MCKQNDSPQIIFVTIALAGRLPINNEQSLSLKE